MINNNLSAGAFIIIFGSKALAEKTADVSSISVLLITYLPVLAVTGIISFVIFIKKEKRSVNITG